MSRMTGCGPQRRRPPPTGTAAYWGTAGATGLSRALDGRPQEAGGGRWRRIDDALSRALRNPRLDFLAVVAPR
jgi:hypothetical protein